MKRGMKRVMRIGRGEPSVGLRGLVALLPLHGNSEGYMGTNTRKYLFYRIQ